MGLLLLRLVLSLQAHAGCAAVDLRDELGGPRMQDGTSWCYANSAADLISQEVGKRISSIDIATTFLLADEKKLDRLRDPGVRNYLDHHPEFEARVRESRQEDIAYQPERILSVDGMVNTGGVDDEAIVLSNLKGLCLASRLPAGEENLNKYLEAIRDDYLDRDEGDAPIGPIGAVENDVAKIMAHSFQRWVDQRCGRRIKPKHALLPREVSVADSLDEYNHLVASDKIDPDEARTLLQDELDRVLDSGKVAAIAYSTFDLYPRGDAKGGSTHGDHSSVVAARKRIGGECYYFVRNHFGQTCGYRREFESRCEKENGGVWVTVESLKHLYSVTSVR